MSVNVTLVQGPVYNERQRERLDNAAMALVILLSLQIMESLQIGVATRSDGTILVSFRVVSLGVSWY